MKACPRVLPRSSRSYLFETFSYFGNRPVTRNLYMYEKRPAPCKETYKSMPQRSVGDLEILLAIHFFILWKEIERDLYAYAKRPMNTCPSVSFAPQKGMYS